MQRTRLISMTIGLALAFVSPGRSAEPDENFLRTLPAGVVLESSTEIALADRNAIAKKLGGDIARLTNSNVTVHGRRIRINALTAADEANAKALHAALLKIRPPIFCLRTGTVVIEFAGNDAALAIKTAYELGLRPKPASVRYRVIAELATIDKADYMACNPLFAQFLALQNGDDKTALQQINDLSKKFQFGHTLMLRNPRLDAAATHTFQPAATTSTEAGATVAYSFGQLPNRQAVPFATATIDIAVDGTGFRDAAAAPPQGLTAATPFWPADDPSLVALARQITVGKTTNDDKAKAILAWLSPGRNLKYGGQTGSRWGTNKAFAQKFGHCWDFSDCFVTLTRAAGVPSRQVAGWLYGSSGHVWAEYYREGKGWQQVDPTGGASVPCGIYHIPYFTSEDGEMPIVYLSLPKVELVEDK